MELYNLEIPGQKIRQLNKRGIETIEDLLEFFPKEYFNFSTPVSIRDMKNHVGGEQIAVVGYLTSFKEVVSSTGKKIVYVNLRDDTGSTSLMFFGKNYLTRILYSGKKYIACGKVTEYQGRVQMVNPRYFSQDIESFQRIIPRYLKVQGMSEEYLQNTFKKAFSFAHLLPDYDAKLFRSFPIMKKEDALIQIHSPANFYLLKLARQRFIFDIIFRFLWMSKEKDEGVKDKTHIIFDGVDLESYLEKLPFKLTEDQDNTVRGILEKLESGEKLNALVQGDVGSGKTIVAFLLMFAAKESGYQSVLIAPTQTLAYQHYLDALTYAEDFGFKAAYLSGETKKREKNKILKELKAGDVDILIGTHAVFSDDVEYKNLGLKIVDEEHRFGVRQREKLFFKYPSIHQISMSATPIPRSLALLSYGNSTEIYTILKMPAGRKKVKTYAFDSNVKAFENIIEEVQKGYQGYIVCPRIEESDKKEDKHINTVETTELELKKYLKFKGIEGVTVGSISGRMKQKDVDEIVESFKQGKIQILISTTIIEVGVNVPNATAIAVLSAEFFGLSQLHQLRGRVGRSSYQSYCFLVSPDYEEKERLKIMEGTNSGFEISKADLRLRGPGDLLGTRQSGESEELSLVLTNPRLTEAIREEIESIFGDKYRKEWYVGNYFEKELG